VSQQTAGLRGAHSGLVQEAARELQPRAGAEAVFGGLEPLVEGV